MSQAQLAEELTRRGQAAAGPIVLRIEKGARPLRLSEAVVAAEVLGVSVLDLVTTNPERAEALQRATSARHARERAAAEVAALRVRLADAEQDLAAATMTDHEALAGLTTNHTEETDHGQR